MKEPLPVDQALLAELRSLIAQTRQRLAVTVNAEMTRLYWAMGRRILETVLFEGRADYGKQAIRKLSKQLTQEFGKGFSMANLTNAIELARLYPDSSIIQTLSEQFSWSHFVTIKDDIKRGFYMEMSRLERWSVRMVKKKMDGMLYERTAISRKPDETIRKDMEQLRQENQLTPEAVYC